MFWFFSEQSSVIRSRESEQAKHRDSVATGRHVETIPSTSSPCGSGDSLQQHIIIITIPHFIMETFPPLLSLWFFFVNEVVVCHVSSSSSQFSDLSPMSYYFHQCEVWWELEKGELHSFWSLHDCGFWFRVESWKQKDRKHSFREVALLHGRTV